MYLTVLLHQLFGQQPDNNYDKVIYVTFIYLWHTWLAATGRNASSSSESVSVSDRGPMSDDDSEGFRFFAIGRLTSGTTRSSED